MGRNTLIQVRRGTTVQWSGQNPVLSQGEWGYDIDLGRFKIGDSLTPWDNLCWASIRPTNNDIVGSDGIGIDLSCIATGNTPLANIKVTGILSSQINDFNPSVSGLLPDITGVSGVSTLFDSSSNTWTVYLDNPSIEVEDITDFDERVDDRVAELLGVPSESPFRNISGINLSYLDDDNRIDIGLDDTVIRTTGDQNISGSLGVGEINAQDIFATGSISGNHLTISNNATFLSDINVSGNINVLGTGISFNEATVVLTTLSVADSGNFGNALTVGNVPVSISGHAHVSTDIIDFTEASQDAIATNAGSTGFLRNGSGLAWTYNDNADTLSIAVTGIPVSLITDLDSYIAENLDTSIVQGTGIGLVYDTNLKQLSINVTGISNTSVAGLGTMSVQNANNVNISNGSINVSGLTVNNTEVSLSGHTHILSNIIDVTASATEVNYLDGSVPGTAVSGKAVVLDVNKDIDGIRNITTEGTLNIGGDLIVHGTTTTVNSTTVNIGDNIIRVNTSGLNTGGFEVYKSGSDPLVSDSYETLLWNTSSNRWDFSGPTVRSTGVIVGRTLESTVSGPTAPLVVVSTGLVANLNSDLLDGQNGSYYLDWTKTTNKPTITGILSGDVVGTGSVTLGDLGGSLTINATIQPVSNNQLIYDWTKIGATELVLGSSVNSISGISSNNPLVLTYAHIDGGTP